MLEASNTVTVFEEGWLSMILKTLTDANTTVSSSYLTFIFKTSDFILQLTMVRAKPKNPLRLTFV